MKRLALGGLVLVPLIPLVAWSLVKPVRVVAPQWAGVTCISPALCIDDPTRAELATGLYLRAAEFVSRQVAPVEGPPRVIFCVTQTCADAFGLGARSAFTVGTWGTVIGPRAWQPYYVRHELIHYVQFKHLGNYRALRSPAWFVEGMAYALSEDPRKPLSEPFESYRGQFLSWYAGMGRDQLWQKAAGL